MSKDIEQAVLLAVRDCCEGASDGGSDGADGEEQIEDMDEDSAVPPKYFYAAHYGGTGVGVAFIDDGIDAAG